MNHAIIMIVVILLASIFGMEVYAFAFMAGFWFGREHAQAEYRYIAANGGKRELMPWYGGFIPRYWSHDAAVNDLAIPVIVGVSVVVIISYLRAFA